MIDIQNPNLANTNLNIGGEVVAFNAKGIVSLPDEVAHKLAATQGFSYCDGEAPRASLLLANAEEAARQAWAAAEDAQRVVDELLGLPEESRGPAEGEVDPEPRKGELLTTLDELTDEQRAAVAAVMAPSVDDIVEQNDIHAKEPENPPSPDNGFVDDLGEFAGEGAVVSHGAEPSISTAHLEESGQTPDWPPVYAQTADIDGLSTKAQAMELREKIEEEYDLQSCPLPEWDAQSTLLREMKHDLHALFNEGGEDEDGEDGEGVSTDA